MLLGKLEDTPAAARATQVSGSSATTHGQAGLFHQQFIHVAQQGAAAGEHDAAFGDVGAELGRRLLERLFDRAHDALQRLLQRLQISFEFKVKLRGTPSDKLRPFDRTIPAPRAAQYGHLDR